MAATLSTWLAGATHAAAWSALLLEATVKGTLLLVLALLAMRPLQRASAAVRHWIWTLAAAAVVALPLLSVLLPVWRVPLFPDSSLWSYAVAKVGRTDAGDDVRPAPAPVSRSAPASDAGRPDAIMPGSPVGPRAQPATALPTALPPHAPWRALLVLLWAAGALLSSAWLALGNARARRLVREATPLRSGRLPPLVQRLRRRIGLNAPVTLLRSKHAITPLTLGVLQPVLLVPPEAEGWSRGRLRVVLLHELAHVKRYDCLAQRAADLACALYWFHPAVWYSARRLRSERERACDDCVLRTGVRPSDYAGHLLALARTFRARVPRPAVAMAQRSRLEERVQAILDPQVRHDPPSRLGFVAATLLIALLVLPLAALDPAPGLQASSRLSVQPPVQVGPSTVPPTPLDRGPPLSMMH